MYVYICIKYETGAINNNKKSKKFLDVILQVKYRG